MKHSEKTIEILFFRFLKEFYAYGRYLKVHNNTKDLLSYVRTKITPNTYSICLLPSTFSWARTLEGDEYWRIIFIIWNYVLYLNGIITSQDVHENVRMYCTSNIVDTFETTYEYSNSPKFREYVNILRTSPVYRF